MIPLVKIYYIWVIINNIFIFADQYFLAYFFSSLSKHVICVTINIKKVK